VSYLDKFLPRPMTETERAELHAARDEAARELATTRAQLADLQFQADRATAWANANLDRIAREAKPGTARKTAEEFFEENQYDPEADPEVRARVGEATKPATTSIKPTGETLLGRL
jgi:hypothetical protein